jgi:hypothetical protein
MAGGDRRNRLSYLTSRRCLASFTKNVETPGAGCKPATRTAPPAPPLNACLLISNCGQDHVLPCQGAKIFHHPARLKSELRRHLRNPRRRRMRHITERGAVDIPVHKIVTEELCMVKRIESLEPEFERSRLRQLSDLVKRNVVVGHPRRVKEPPRRGARSSECVGAEQRSVKYGLPLRGS